MIVAQCAPPTRIGSASSLRAWCAAAARFFQGKRSKKNAQDVINPSTAYSQERPDDKWEVALACSINVPIRYVICKQSMFWFWCGNCKIVKNRNSIVWIWRTMGSYDGLFACQRDSFLKEVKAFSHVICWQLIYIKYIVMYCWNTYCVRDPLCALFLNFKYVEDVAIICSA